MIEEGRHLNREVLEVWAANKINKMATRFESKHKNARKDVKKLCWHSTFGKIHVEEQVYRIGARGNRFRPFSEAVGVSSHSYSHCLQRAICDFGSDNAFGVVNKKTQRTLWNHCTCKHSANYYRTSCTINNK